MNERCSAHSEPHFVFDMTRPLGVQRVKNPMSLAEICRKIDNKKYAEDPEKSIKLFLRDLALIESNCKRFNKVKEAT